MISQLKKKLVGEKVEQIASLTIHLTDNCNVRCEHCSYSTQKWKNEVTDYLIDEIVSHDPFYTCIVGGGEPTFLSDPVRFSEILRKFRDGSVYMLCNGTIVPSLPEIWVPKFDFIRISLDAGSPETYMKIKGVDFYSKVRRNIEKLLELGVNKVGISFVAQKNVIDDLPKLLKELSYYFFKYGYRFFIRIKPLRGYDPLLPSIDHIKKVTDLIMEETVKSFMFKRFIEEATDFNGLKDMNYSITGVKPISAKCYYSLLYVLITATGEVYPCGLMSRKSKKSLGNLNTSPWSAILENQKQFFETLNPVEDEDCKGCWEIDKNKILEEIVKYDIDVNPSLTKLGGISTLYCRY
jgi:radical SAM protein with 4Fe4S-binding SPASM domain